VGAAFLWFYFQLSTYPYKVARWFQPIEAKIISNFSVNCSQDSGWLKLAAIHGATHQGAYSSQIAYKSPNGQLSHCEIGYQKEFLGRKVKPESRYRYASTSKLITTSAISALIASGKMHLDDKLVSFFPELKNFVDDRVKKITVAHLL